MTKQTQSVGTTSQSVTHISALLKSVLCVQVVINNAGLLYWNSLESVTPQEMIDSYKVNTMGPLFVVQSLLAKGLLPSGSLIATLTSLVRFHCK